MRVDHFKFGNDAEMENHIESFLSYAFGEPYKNHIESFLAILLESLT